MTEAAPYQVLRFTRGKGGPLRSEVVDHAVTLREASDRAQDLGGEYGVKMPDASRNANERPRVPPCLTCGGKRGNYTDEQDGTLSWTCSRCGDEWSDVGGDRG